jgi:D-3-phosphoglycerate dehydrogenase
MGFKILVTPRSFTKDSEPLKMLQALGYEVVLNPFGRILTKAEMIELISDVDGVIVGLDPIDKEVLKHASRLKCISKYGVGTDNIDLAEAERMGIPVTVTLGANKEAVADYTFALILSVARKITEIDSECKQGNWGKITTVDVWDKTLGLIGLGNIGKGVARRAMGFQMRVLAYDLYQDQAYADANHIEYVSLDTLLAESDFFSVHLPLTEQTYHLIGTDEINKMKETAIIINTARGGLIDEEALYLALKSQRIWGAGIDVFEEEPPSNKAFLELKNIIIGSHCAASTVEAVKNMGIMSSDNLVKNLL